MCHQGVESKEHYVCHCSVFYEIRGRGFGPLRKVMEYEDQRCLRFILLELNRHREKVLNDKNTTTQAHPQRIITTFFNPITPTNATSRSRDTQSSSNNYTFTSCHKIYSQLYDAQLTTGVNYVCI